MNTIKVSIIIPVYNVEKYLRQCLDSVINQTLRDIEIICINDGSTDGSADILREYSSADGRITVITQENRGLSAARNAGIRRAAGKYIYFLDSDDYIEKNAMERLYQQAEGNDLDILYFDRDIVYDISDCQDGRTERKMFSRDNEYADVYSGQELFAAMRAAGDYSVTVWTMFFSRAFCVDNQLWFTEGIYHEDLLFSLQAVLAAKRASHRNWILYHYRIRDDSITERKKNIQHLYGVLYTIMEIKNILWKGHFSEEVETQIIKFLETEVRHVRNIYFEMDEVERAHITSLRPVEFDALNSILEVGDLNQKLKAAYQTSAARRDRITTLQDEIVALKTKFQIDMKEMSRARANAQAALEEMSCAKAKAENDIEQLIKSKRDLENQLHDTTVALQDAEASLITCQSDIKHLKQQANDWKIAFQHIEKSLSFRLGRAITWLPRMIRKCFLRCKYHP